MRAAAFGGWIAVAGLAWLAGIAAQLQEAALRAGVVYGAAAVGAVVFAVVVALTPALSRRRERGRARRAGIAIVLIAMAAALAGYAATGIRATLRIADTLPAELEGRDLVVEGVIASLPQRGANGTRFRFDIDEASRRVLGFTLPARVSLGWYAGGHDDAASASPQRELRAGQRWRFTLRLRRPHGNLNPHGFDFELWLFEQRVGATGYVRDAPPPRLVAEAAGHPVDRLRQRVRDAIAEHVADRRSAGVLAALAVGDQGAIDREDWELFRTTGIAHLVSISGLHVTMFAWLAGALVAAAWRRSGRATLAIPAAQAGRWGGLLAATGYAVFAGWGVPAQRTVWMLATVVVLRSVGVRWPWPHVLLAAAVVVTVLDPWAMTQAGFWLSFAAVGLLLVSAPVQADATTASFDSPRLMEGSLRAAGRRGLDRFRALAGAGMRTQVVATLGLAPLTLVFFQQLSLVGFVANLVAIPLVTLVVTPLALLGVIAPPLWSLGAATVQLLSAFLQMLASASGSVWIVPAAPLWAQLAGLVAGVLVVLPLPWRLKLLAPALALPLLVPPVVSPVHGEFEVLAADVGQGSAVLIRTHRHALLFDAGPQYSRDSDAGRRVLVPLLRAVGSARLDALVLSHRDLDHVGGANAVLANLAVERVSSSLEADHPLATAAGARASRCEAGQRWRWDGVDFAMLRPPAADYERGRKPNAMSCVLRVAAATRSILLAGDIEADQESELVIRGDRDALRSDVLLVPHHGSRTSSTAAFIEAVAPQVAIVQAGYRNRFGHPAADVLARYRERGVAVVTSARCGAWRWRSGQPLGAARCERDAARRYWHHGG